MRIDENNNLPLVIQNYLNIQNIIDANQSKLFYEIFEKIKTNQLSSVNIILDNRIQDGFSLIPKEKEELLVNQIDPNSVVEMAINNFNQDTNDLKKAYYIKGLNSLINNLSYIDEEEQFILDCLFQEIYIDKVHIEEFGDKRKEYVIK